MENTISSSSRKLATSEAVVSLSYVNLKPDIHMGEQKSINHWLRTTP